jgi:hypothetical protein
MARRQRRHASGDLGADVLPLAEGVRGVAVDQAKRLKELEQENAKLKQTHQWAAVNSPDDELLPPLLCREADALLLTALAKPL